jgi:serine/threonine-protein kinase
VTWISDEAVGRLRAATESADFTGTRYRVFREIGRGGMGVVYEADDEVLGRRVAIKVLGAALASGEDAERLRLEARTVAALEHPGIVPVHDLGELPDGRLFYAMKLVRGARLDAWAAEVPISERLRAFLRICDAVGFAHAHGVVHRDLKPSNVMVGEFGAVLVMDWGLARETRPSVAARSIAGTPGYMAPEQERGEPATEASDVFALGAILEFLGGVGADADDRRPVPKPLAAVAARAKAQAPAGRYPTAASLAEDVTRHLDGLVPAAYREGFWERLIRLLRRHKALATLVVAYLVMRALVFLFLHR